MGIKIPLSIHVFYHRECTEGARLYSDLYRLLCRNPDCPYMDGLDIPVYFATGDDSDIGKTVKMVEMDSQKNLILLLIDDNMFCSEMWRTYVKSLIDRHDNQLKIVGIKLSHHAFVFLEELSNDQMITPKCNSVFHDFEDFKTRLYDTIIRFLSEDGTKKLQIFISHSKRDLEGFGEKMAQEVRQFLSSDTKLGSFYDVHDLLDGYSFAKQLKKNVSKSLVLVLFTDTYSSREWCRIETLTAKKVHVPLVVVSLLKNRADRLFPYIGNVPGIVYHDDWHPIINLLLRTAIDYRYESQLLSSICEDSSDYLPCSPEAYSLSEIKADKRIIYYPEPPLGNEEMEILQKINRKAKKQCKFKTPIEYNVKNMNLKKKQIAISVADSEDMAQLGIGPEMLRDLTTELSRHILKAGGRMIYGGDLRKDGFTELFRDLSYQYGQYEKERPEICYFRNFLAWPLYKNISLSVVAEYKSCRVDLVEVPPSEAVPDEAKSEYIPPICDENRYMWATSLTAMRYQEEQEAVARILVGGKKSSFTGRMAGIVEEFIIAREKNHPIYLIGGFGGAAKVLVDIIEKKDGVSSETLKQTALSDAKTSKLYKYYDSQGQPIDYTVLDGTAINDLNNGLDEEENKRLFHSVNVMEIVSLVLKGLQKKFCR